MCVANFSGHASGRSSFKGARHYKATLVVVHRHAKLKLPGACLKECGIVRVTSIRVTLTLREKSVKSEMSEVKCLSAPVQAEAVAVIAAVTSLGNVELVSLQRGALMPLQGTICVSLGTSPAPHPSAASLI